MCTSLHTCTCAYIVTHSRVVKVHVAVLTMQSLTLHVSSCVKGHRSAQCTQPLQHQPNGSQDLPPAHQVGSDGSRWQCFHSTHSGTVSHCSVTISSAVSLSVSAQNCCMASVHVSPLLNNTQCGVTSVLDHLSFHT